VEREFPEANGRCPISDETWDGIVAFAREHGRNWRAKLRKVWALDQDADGSLRSAILRSFRNAVGPGRRLDKVGRSLVPEKKEKVRPIPTALMHGGQCKDCGELVPRDGICRRPHEEKVSE
jgi:hypothetical protein